MRGIFSVAMTIGFFIMGIVQLLAMYALLVDYWDWPKLLAIPIGMILAYIPVIGSICGFFGALYAWDWEWWQAVLLFFWQPVVWLLFFIIGYTMETGASFFQKKGLVQQKALEGETNNRLCLFGDRSRSIREHFPFGIWVMRAYFFLACWAYAAILFLLIIGVNAGANFWDILPALLFAAFMTWIVYSMYGMKVYGFATMPLLVVAGKILTFMQVIESRTTPRELFGFLLGLCATWIAWKARKQMQSGDGSDGEARTSSNVRGGLHPVLRYALAALFLWGLWGAFSQREAVPTASNRGEYSREDDEDGFKLIQRLRRVQQIARDIMS